MHFVTAQKIGSTSTRPFYINIFISHDKNIYLENHKIDFDDIENQVSEIIRNKPFILDQEIVYRIFADEDLGLGLVSDVNRRMLSAYHDHVKSERYLLNSTQLNIDGQNWFEEIDMKDLKKLK